MFLFEGDTQMVLSVIKKNEQFPEKADRWTVGKILKLDTSRKTTDTSWKPFDWNFMFPFKGDTQMTLSVIKKN